MLHYLSIIYRKYIVIWLVFITGSPSVLAGVEKYIARESQIKYVKSYTMPISPELSNITYLAELFVLGLVAAALLFITFSIVSRRINAKKEYENIKLLRQSAETQKAHLDRVLVDALNIEKQLEKSIANTQSQLNEVAKQSSQAEKSAREIKTLEQNAQELTTALTHKYEALSQNNTDTQPNIEKKVIDQVAQSSKALLTQINEYQQRAETAFGQFTNTLGNFESQAHGQFDEIFNAADIARQELNANIDESREYLKIFRGSQQDKVQTITPSNNDNGTPLNKEPSQKPVLQAAHIEDQELAGFFAKFRQRDSA